MPKKLLLLTNVDLGQANVFLGVAAALLQSRSQVEIHFATFGALESEVHALGQQLHQQLHDVSDKVAAVDADADDAAAAAADAAPDVTDAGAGAGAAGVKLPALYFHKIEGPAMREGLERQTKMSGIATTVGHWLPQSYLAPLGTKNTMRAIRDTTVVFIPYHGPQLGKVYSSIVDIIATVSPDLVLVDGLMTAGLTACYHLHVNFHILSPNSIREFAGPYQPNAAGLWKFPALFSGFAYPVPWHLIPLNIFFVLYAVYHFQRSPSYREAQEWMANNAKAQLRTPMDLLRRDRPPQVKILVGSWPELDFPVVVPDHVRPCGPILRHSRPVEADDADLAAWLAKGPTIYINLGSMCCLSEDRAIELARAIKAFLASTTTTTTTYTNTTKTSKRRFQVLWKLKQEGSYHVREPGSKIFGILADEFAHDRLRVCSWLVPEPIALLGTGHIACSIHHGGANSYYEAISAGVPQVVLPQWIDCYDYAQRVEYLGVGRIGNRTSRPLWEAEELAGAIGEVLVGTQSDAIKEKAMELSRLCKRNGDGALKVVDFVTQELRI